jgi:hypothetical protein
VFGQPVGFLFHTAAGGLLKPDRVSKLFRTLNDDSRLPPVRLHDLRHGAASLSLAAGNDLRTVQNLLGHASIVLTAVTIKCPAQPRPPGRGGDRSSCAGCRASNGDSAADASPARPAQGRDPATGARGQTTHHDRPHGCLRTTA